jgi:hypothetical protein
METRLLPLIQWVAPDTTGLVVETSYCQPNAYAVSEVSRAYFLQQTGIDVRML